ncbi:MAG: transporter [Prevotella sp.]|nr:transporter [Prevotella sp.]
MMRRAAILMVICFACMAATAQEVGGGISTTDSIEVLPQVMKSDTYNAIQSTRTYSPEEYVVRNLPMTQRTDSLHLPTLDNWGRVWSTRMPYFRPGWSTWDLHQGLNVNIGASVFAGFGKHSSGAGFGQSLSAMYATPLTSKLSLAVGGYFSNLYWSHSNFRSAGVSAVLGYRFDNHWEAFLYGQKSLTDNRLAPLPLYDIGNWGDRIGAAIRYNFNPSFSVEVSVERGWMPHRDSIHDTYMQMPRGDW